MKKRTPGQKDRLPGPRRAKGIERHCRVPLDPLGVAEGDSPIPARRDLGESRGGRRGQSHFCCVKIGTVPTKACSKEEQHFRGGMKYAENFSQIGFLAIVIAAKFDKLWISMLVRQNVLRACAAVGFEVFD